MSEEFIDVICFDEIQEQQTNSMFPSPRKLMATTKKVALKAVQRNFSKFVENIESVLDSLPNSSKSHTVDSVSLAITIDSNGKVSLIGEVGGSITSAITINFKRRRRSKQ